MTKEDHVPAPPSPSFVELFRKHANTDGLLRFDRFMELALYHPAVGYYRKSRPRVGRSEDTDFFTSTTSGPLFGELICAASLALLGGAENAGKHTFVEIGAEPGTSILSNVRHPFPAVVTIRLGDAFAFSGACVVFSNELFDAQPFRRFMRKDESWYETGVGMAADGTFFERELTETALPSELPPYAPPGYRLDLPLASIDLLNQIADRTWSGLFLACDYGKSWRELVEATPAGSARAYRRHRQSNDLLANPGEQDLTCHICWDWLEAALQQKGFKGASVESQEAFFVRHAGELIARISAEEATRLSPRKLALMQLLHPAHLGQKFQVLRALRA